MRAVLLVVLGGCQLVFPVSDPPVDTVTPADRWQTVTAGFGHTCALDVDGALFCWGRNLDGELGRMGTAELATIRQVGTATWRSVTTAGRHTCGIQADDTSWCWGANDFGTLGNNSELPSVDPVATTIGATHAIATSVRHTCAIALDRTLWCWGQDEVGELGRDMPGMDSLVPVPVTTELRWEAVAAGSTTRTRRPGTTCGIASDHTLWCWGQALGDDATHPVPSQLGTDTWRAISIGADHACGITEAGAMRCWGDNANGQLGNGLTASSPLPVGALVDNEDRFYWTAVGVNGDTSCGIAGGHWYCWGSSATGQLGRDGTAINATPIELGSERTYLALATGIGHTCAVAADHTLWCLGSRGFSQLGDGSSSVQVPHMLEGTWRTTSVGDNTVCAIATDGSLQCTGDNRFGTLGNGSNDGRQRFDTVDGDLWSAISVGSFHTCGVRGGEVQCWGQDYTGQATGIASGAKLSPTSLSPTIVADAVTTGGEHSCALRGTQAPTKCWGKNASGQLGRPVSQSVAAADVQGTSFLVVEGGDTYTCGIDSLEHVRCWGNHIGGRLGTTMTITTSFPTPIENSNTFAALSVGNASACGLDTAGSLFCWGTNFSGELGLGDRGTVVEPEQVAGTWSAISVGAEHSCGLQGDRLFCWGSNTRGQLGSGSFADSLTPQLVSAGWKAVSAGNQTTCAIDAGDQLWCWGDNSQGQLGTGDAWRLEPVRVTSP